MKVFSVSSPPSSAQMSSTYIRLMRDNEEISQKIKRNIEVLSIV
jgi:7-keto-8-aminopelargonate synthetase-like enzyme